MSAMPQSQPDRQCLGCGTAPRMKRDGYCSDCFRGRRKPKYEASEFIDAQIRRFYRESGRRQRGAPNLKGLARRLGWDVSALRRRAIELGLARPKDTRAWSDQETELLERFAWMSARRIAEQLKEAGFHRSELAIEIKRRVSSLADPEGTYSSRGLAECFGTDSHVVQRWIKLGYLKAERRGEGYTESSRGTFAIHRADVRAFVRKYPNEFDIRKVCQPWFMDLVFDGRICRTRA